MSLWRRIAIEKLPELQSKVASAGNAYGVWLELRDALTRAYRMEPPNESLISRIHEHAAWCWRLPHNADLRTAVAVCFYESLLLEKPVRKELTRWLSQDEFTALWPVFGYHLSQSEVDRFADESRAEISRRIWHRSVER